MYIPLTSTSATRNNYTTLVVGVHTHNIVVGEARELVRVLLVQIVRLASEHGSITLHNEGSVVAKQQPLKGGGCLCHL